MHLMQITTAFHIHIRRSARLSASPALKNQREFISFIHKITCLIPHRVPLNESRFSGGLVSYLKTHFPAIILCLCSKCYI